LESNSREEALTKSLREEAWQVKHCFTQYAIATMAFASAVLVGIARLQYDHPLVALCSIPLVGVILAVIRIGTHKYGTANRLYGYLLHLERTRKLSKADAKRAELIRDLGWEEAMRAWRVVQPTVFERVYESGTWKRNILQPPFRGLKRKWFEPVSLVMDGAKWFSGRYLENTSVVLHALSWVAVTPLLFLLVQFRNEKRSVSLWGLMKDPLRDGRGLYLVATLIIALAILIGFRYLKTSARLQVLEDGLLSINSCAMMWHAVVVAHRRALLALPPHTGVTVDDYEGYTEELSRCALCLAKDLVAEAKDANKRRCTTAFHDWIQRDDCQCRARRCEAPVRQHWLN